MQRLLTISFLLFLVALVSAKHTLHVDNVLPNFGETVLVSGPFKADSIDIDLIDVAELTVQSVGGIDITSNIDLSLNGAAVDASAPGVYNLTTGSDFTITSATTTQIVGGDVNLNADNQLSIRSLGEFRFASLGVFNFTAGAADLSGESLDVNSATGGFYVTSNTLTTSSPALSLSGMSVANFSAASVLLEADQNIKMKSARIHMATDNLVMESIRTNLLLEGYLYLEVLADNFRVRAKGSGQFEAANGDLEFLNVNDVTLRGSQDMITQVQDSLRYSATGDIRIQSGGDVRIAADSDALFYSDSEASINGIASIRSIGRHFVSKSGSGDISMNVFNGPFNATSSDYTRVYSEGLLSFSSSDDVVVSGLQGIALRAERGQLYINSPPTGNVGGGRVNYTSENSLFFTGDYVGIKTGSLDIDGQDVRFETADAARSAVQNWDIATEATFTLDSDFLLGSSSVQVLSEDDLVITAGQDAVFVANENSGSALRIYNANGYSDVAIDSVRHIGNQVDVAVTTSITNNANEDIDVRARDELTVDGEVIAFTTPDVTYDTAFANTIQGISSISLTAVTESISMAGGRFTFDTTDIFTADFDDEINMAASNLDFDADLEARYVTETTSYNADRYIIMNGDMAFSYPDVVINGNLIAGSPPGTDITFTSPAVGFGGPLSVNAYDVLFDIENGVSFYPFSFTVTSGEELPITFTAEDDLDVAGDDIRFDTAKGDLDNEVAFLARTRMTLSAAEDFDVLASNDISFNAPAITVDAPNAARLVAYDVDIRSVNGFTLNSKASAVFNATGNSRFIAQDGNLNLNFDVASIRSGNELYFRSNQQMFWTSGDDMDLLGSREITFEGGDQSITAENVFFKSTNEIDIQGFDGVTLSALDDLSLTATRLLDVHSQEFTADAGETNTLSSDDIVLSTENLEGPIYIQQTNPAGTNAVVGSVVRYQSNDELITNVDGAWTATSSGDFLMQTSSEDAGMLFYSRSTTNVQAENNIDVTVRDSALDGKDVRWQSSTSALFQAGNGLFMTSNGFEYDPNFDQQVGMLYRAESGDINFTSGLNTIVNGKRGLRWESLDQGIKHETDTGDITMVGQQLVIRSADDLLQNTITGDFTIDLSEYAIWQAGDDTSVFAGSDLRLEAGNDIDIITDSGFIEFQYRGTVSQDYIADSLVAEGDAAFSWTIGGDYDTDSGSYNNFADSDLSVSAGNNMVVSTVRDTFFVSSLNNDASFIAGTDLTATATGKMEYYSGRDIVWDSTTGTSAYNALDITFTSAGSITTESTGNTAFTSAADLKITADNRVDFESSGTITVGGPNPTSSIISVSAGGDRTDFGVYIATDDFIKFTTNADLTETVGQFVVDSEGVLYDGTRIVIDARGADSLGEDVTFESLQGTVSLTSAVKTDLEGTDVRYEYDSTLSFDSESILTIKAATIVDMEALGAMSVKAPTWETNAGTYLYASRGDTTVDASGKIRFSNTQQVTGNVQHDIEFEAGTTASFTTAGANSPITFRTENVNSEFAIELNGAKTTTFDAVQKTTITTVDGQFFGSDNNIELSAADDYTITADDNIYYDARTGDLSINGLGAFGSGSRIQVSSGGNLIINTQTTTTLSAPNDQIAFLPDESLTFAAYRNTETLDAFTVMTVTLTDDVVGEFDEDFTFMAANALFSGKTMDMTFNGIKAEEGVGARFTGYDSVVGTSGRRFRVTGDNVNFQGSDVQIGATGAGIFNTLGGMSFNTTEVSTDIKVTTTTGTATFTATQLLSITTTGDEPGVGYIRMEATGFSDGTEYPWFDSTVDPNDDYSIGFVARQDDIAVNIENGRFIVENLVTAEVTPGPNGNLLMQANGADESGYGVTVESTDVTISSGDNVALRAENIYFNELVSDVYVRADNRPLLSPYNTTLFRPTIQSIHDQTWTSFGQNKAGNGIELTTDVPVGGITFNVGNVQFDSGNDAEIVSEQVNAFESQYDTNVLSRRSIHISGNGNSVDRNSVSILAVSPGTETPSVEFNAENDIILEASQRLIGELEGEFDMRGWRTLIDGGSIHLESAATTTFSSPTRVRVTDAGEISMAADGDATFTAGTNIDMTANASQDGFSDIYFGDPETVSGGDVLLVSNTPNNFELDARIVDVTSQNALVIPPNNAANCGTVGNNGLYFTTGPPTIHFCIGNNDNGIQFYNGP